MHTRGRTLVSSSAVSGDCSLGMMDIMNVDDADSK